MKDKLLCTWRAFAPLLCIVCALFAAYHEHFCFTIAYSAAGIILAITDIAYILIDGLCDLLALFEGDSHGNE